MGASRSRIPSLFLCILRGLHWHPHHAPPGQGILVTYVFPGGRSFRPGPPMGAAGFLNSLYLARSFFAGFIDFFFGAVVRVCLTRSFDLTDLTDLADSFGWGEDAAADWTRLDVLALCCAPSAFLTFLAGAAAGLDVAFGVALVVDATRPYPTMPEPNRERMRTFRPERGASMVLPLPMYIRTCPKPLENTKSPGSNSDRLTRLVAWYWAAAVRGSRTPPACQERIISPEQSKDPGPSPPQR